MALITNSPQFWYNVIQCTWKEEWDKVTKVECDSIQRNETLELEDMPKGKSANG